MGATIIDHINTNIKNNLSVGIIKNDVSDHYSPFLIINLADKIKKPKTKTAKKRIFSDENTNKLVDNLKNKNQDNIQQELDVNTAFENFFYLYENSKNETCPLVNRRV